VEQLNSRANLVLILATSPQLDVPYLKMQLEAEIIIFQLQFIRRDVILFNSTGSTISQYASADCRLPFYFVFKFQGAAAHAVVMIDRNRN
jgi:hypothetical protein